MRTRNSSDWRSVVFLGAGASKPYGYPLTDGILAEIWRGVEDGSWKDWPGLKKKTGRSRGEDIKPLRKLIRILLPGLTSRKSSTDGSSIIDVLSLLDQLLLENRMPAEEISEDEMRRARAMLQVALNAVLRGQAQGPRRSRLARWVLTEAIRRRGSAVSVVSTNYDTTLDLPLFRMLLDAKVPVGRHVDFGIPWRDSSRDIVHMRPPDARLAVLKLHGSLNWLRCETCGHVSINVRQRIASLEFWRTLRVYNQCQCGSRLRSLLVTPSFVRDVRDANLLSVWHAALEHLRRADEWIMIGYSFPSEDIAIRSLLLRAFHSRLRKSLRIRVIQWAPPKEREPGDAWRQQGEGRELTAAQKIRLRYEAFFPPGHLDPDAYSLGGVEPFIDSLHPLSQGQLHKRVKRAFTGAGYRTRR